MNVTDAVVRCFAGQTEGKRKEIASRTGLFADEIYSNKKIELTERDILKNVQELQREYFHRPTAGMGIDEQINL